MSSFSSVVRKGPKVAPRVAPRRNIVRKAPSTVRENALEVDKNASTDNPLPTPPATGEDADTQPSLSTRESSISHVHNDTPEAANRDTTKASHSTVAKDGLIPSIASHEPSPANAPADHVSVSDTLQTSRNPSSLRQMLKDGHARNINQPQGTELVSNTSRDSVQAAQSLGERVTNGTRDSAAQSNPRPSRKRKQTPRASATIILSQASVPTRSTTPPAPDASPTRTRANGRAASHTSSISSQRSSIQPSTSQNEFDRISSRLQIVQDASAAINAHARSVERSTRSESPAASSTGLASADQTTEQAINTRPAKRRKITRAKRRTAEEQAADVMANVTGSNNESIEPRQKRVRGATPENAETHEITPETTTMGDICDDNKRGKKSETEKEMAANWDEILRRRKEDAEERMALAAAGSRRRREKGSNIETNSEPTAAVVPVMAIENGVIVTASRQIDRQAILEAGVQQTNEADIREDKDIYKRVLATTVGCRNPQTQGQVWDDLSTELFYTGLKKFGTDFQMISATIPGKTRKQVKHKYNIEERKNWPWVKKCLSTKEEVNLDEYAEATGVQFASVTDVYRQMEEDEKRLHEEDEQRRRDEGIISQDQTADTAANGHNDGEAEGDGEVDGSGEADVAIPSIETGAEAAAREVIEAAFGGGTRGGDRQSTTSRVGSTTTARQTAQPSVNAKRRQMGKKSAAASKKGRQAAGKNKGLEGVEERIGGIEEVGMPEQMG